MPAVRPANLDELLLSAVLLAARRYADSVAFRVGVRQADWPSEAVVAFRCAMPSDATVRRHRGEVAGFLAALATPAEPLAEAPAVTCVVGGPADGRGGADLVVSAEATPDGVVVHVDLHEHVHDAAAGDQLLGHLATLLGQLDDDTAAVLGDLRMLTDAEYVEWRHFNATGRPYPREASVYQLFAAQVAASPDQPAVVVDDGVLTYRQLADRAEALAGTLAARGLGTGDRIAFLLDRRPELLVAVLAILRLGAAYVPVDAGLPPARRDFVLADSGAVALLVDDGSTTAPVPVLDVTRPGQPVDHDVLPALATAPEDDAYVMYTSGTTGQPKGVLVNHRAVVRLVRGTDFVDLSPATRILQTGAIAFDATTFEFWGALLNGGALVLVPDGALFEAARLRAAMTRHGVNTMWLTSSLFNQLVEQDPSVFSGCQVIVGGEALSPGHVTRAERACPDATFVNGYGPTENTTFSLTHRITGAQAGRVPIGRPIANSTAWVLDHDGHPQPLGVPGELYVGGDGLSSGYLNRPELTAEAFGRRGIDGERLYRTGDIACRRTDGLLDYLGRTDDQVKIRGFRVELAEVEGQLRTVAGVQEAVVVLRQRAGTGPVLAAYVTGHEKLDGASLRAVLLTKLPEYMVPTGYRQVEAMPLTRNQKVDRAALAQLEPVDCAAAIAGGRPPRTELERSVAGVFAAVLGLTTVSIDDDFFALGGHSLLAMRLWSELRSTLGIEVELTQVMDNPTVAGLAASLARQPTAAATRPRLTRRAS
ncbi:amino acid adenylation domain-containing protein [Micromonospora sp. NPDC049275]|uniref:amino acid adenylation domain-containing protein n=1 Tax=Micromonospora sp. NPDC049275 TaxID=3364268 RepID=UPI003712AB11